MKLKFWSGKIKLKLQMKNADISHTYRATANILTWFSNHLLLLVSFITTKNNETIHTNDGIKLKLKYS